MPHWFACSVLELHLFWDGGSTASLLCSTVLVLLQRVDDDVMCGSPPPQLFVILNQAVEPFNSTVYIAGQVYL
jgi:hypothetical protein